MVLLRRQLSQEKPRNRPVDPPRAGRSRCPPIWRRDWHSYLRFPMPRLLRMLALAIVAGLSLGAMWRGATAMFIVAGLALYLAAYDAVEPIAQEIDHPTRWESYPGRQRSPADPAPAGRHHHHGPRLRRSPRRRRWSSSPGKVVGQLAVPMILTVAVCATIAAAVSTSMGSPNVAQPHGARARPAGLRAAARLVAPPAIAVASLMPLLAAGRNPDAHQPGQGQQRWCSTHSS